MVEIEWRAFGDGQYEASNIGVIRRINDKRIVSCSVGRNGYYKCTIRSQYGPKTWSVHVAVAEAFYGKRPKGCVVNHMDSNRLNNFASNLEYITQAENIHHALRLGRMATGNRHGSHTHAESWRRGSSHANSILVEADIPAIRRRRELGETYTALGIAYGVSRGAIWRIVNGYTWRHVQ